MWWRDLLFIHYPSPEVVQALLPDDLTIDTWPDADGIQRAWVALVPFEMVVGTPVAAAAVRRHVSRNQRAHLRPGPDGTPGVWFCSLEAGGLLASLTARARTGFPTWPICRLTPGAGRPTACGVTTPPPVAPPPHDRRGTAVPSQCRPYRDTHRRRRRLGLRTLPHVTLGALFPFPSMDAARVHRLCPRRSRTLALFAANSSNSTTNSSTLPDCPSRPVTRSCTGRRGPKSVSVGHGGRAVPESVSRARCRRSRRNSPSPRDTHRGCAPPELATVVGDTPLLGRFTAQLEPDLVEHAQPRCSDRMTECLQATVAVDRQAAVETERTVEHIRQAWPGSENPRSSINTSSVGVKQS